MTEDERDRFIRAALHRYKVRTRWTVAFSERCKSNAKYAVFDGKRQMTALMDHGRAHAARDALTIGAITEIFADHTDNVAPRELAE